MREPKEYLKEALQKRGIFINLITELDIVTGENALNALQACLDDHERFVAEQLEKVDRINAQLAELMQKIDRINSSIH